MALAWTHISPSVKNRKSLQFSYLVSLQPAGRSAGIPSVLWRISNLILTLDILAEGVFEFPSVIFVVVGRQPTK